MVSLRGHLPSAKTKQELILWEIDVLTPKWTIGYIGY